MPTQDEILDIIMNSNPKNDWERTNLPSARIEIMTEPGNLSGYLEGKEVVYYKKDVNLRIEYDAIAREDFREEWANKHPDPRASSYNFTLYYANTPIQNFLLVSVDGARALLPIPYTTDPKNDKYLKVPILKYKFAQILDQINTLNEYMQRSGLSVE